MAENDNHHPQTSAGLGAVDRAAHRLPVEIIGLTNLSIIGAAALSQATKLSPSLNGWETKKLIKHKELSARLLLIFFGQIILRTLGNHQSAGT